MPAQYARTVAGQCPDAQVYAIPQGEGSKCLKVYGQVLQAMLDFGMDRGDLLVAVGGGVVGDLGGFCAASYMRGIDFVNCPTTTLAQVIPPSAARRPSTWGRPKTSWGVLAAQSGADRL